MLRPDPSSPRAQWVAYAKWLAYFTLAYNLLEGLVSMGFGWADGSLSLFGFGADSFIEVGSGLLVLWRLGAEGACASSVRLHRERRAAQGIGALLVALAVGTAAGAVLQLKAGRHPETTVPGLAVSLLSLLAMAWLWRAKVHAAKALDSGTVRADAACSLACIQLSGVLFVGSLVCLVAPRLGWADAVAALLLSAAIAKEGFSTLRAASRKDYQGGCGCH